MFFRLPGREPDHRGREPRAPVRGRRRGASSVPRTAGLRVQVLRTARPGKNHIQDLVG